MQGVNSFNLNNYIEGEAYASVAAIELLPATIDQHSQVTKEIQDARIFVEKPGSKDTMFLFVFCKKHKVEITTVPRREPPGAIREQVKQNLLINDFTTKATQFEKISNCQEIADSLFAWLTGQPDVFATLLQQQIEKLHSTELIGGTAYAALESSLPFIPNWVMLLVSRELQHAMLFVEAPNSPDQLLRYEFGKAYKVKISQVERSSLPSGAIRHRVKPNTRVCDVTNKAERFVSSKYGFLKGVWRRYVNRPKPECSRVNNCQTFVDDMFEWLTGETEVVSSKLIAAQIPLIVFCLYVLNFVILFVPFVQILCDDINIFGIILVGIFIVLAIFSSGWATVKQLHMRNMLERARRKNKKPRKVLLLVSVSRMGGLILGLISITALLIVIWAKSTTEEMYVIKWVSALVYVSVVLIGVLFLIIFFVERKLTLEVDTSRIMYNSIIYIITILACLSAFLNTYLLLANVASMIRLDRSAEGVEITFMLSAMLLGIAITLVVYWLWSKLFGLPNIPFTRCTTLLSVTSNASEWVTVECPARLDLAGNFMPDNAPMCYEHGSAACNVAVLVNGIRPIGVRVRLIGEPVVKCAKLSRRPKEIRQRAKAEDEVEDTFTLNDERVEFKLIALDLNNYHQPNALGALVEACLVCGHLVSLEPEAGSRSFADQLRNTFNASAAVQQARSPTSSEVVGLELEMWSELPLGYGVGSKGILGAAILAALWRLARQQFNEEDIVNTMLDVAQKMTSFDGLLDPMGGVFGGVKFGRMLPPPVEKRVPSQKQVVAMDYLGHAGKRSRTSQPRCSGCADLSDDEMHTLQEFEKRLVLIYTGQSRLSPNPLENVIIRSSIHDKQLSDGAENCFNAFLNGDLNGVGVCVNDYWKLKKTLSPCIEPEFVTRLRAALHDGRNPVLICSSFEGAGSGGFLYGLLAEGVTRECLASALADVEGSDVARIYDAKLDYNGLTIS